MEKLVPVFAIGTLTWIGEQRDGALFSGSRVRSQSHFSVRLRRIAAAIVAVAVMVGIVHAVEVVRAPRAEASHSEFQLGDIFTGGYDSFRNRVGWLHRDTTFNATLPTYSTPPSPGVGCNYTTGMAFDRAGNLYATTFCGRVIAVFDHRGNFVRHISDFGGVSPESIVFDAAGNFYVGDADRRQQVGNQLKAVVVKFDPSGVPVRTFVVDREDRGSDWMDLGADQCTLYYTSEGKRVLRYDVCRDTQLPDFAAGLPGSHAFALRLLSDGGMLVADDELIVRLNASGEVVQTYDVGDQKTDLFALTLDPDGRSFYSAEIGARSSSAQGHGQLYKFDIDGGYARLGPVAVANPGTQLSGLAVFGEPVAAAPPPVAHPNSPPTPDVVGLVTGVEGTPVRFDASGSSDPDGDGLGFSWDFGDSSPLGAGVEPGHVYSDNGDYVAQVEVTDDFGLTSTVSVPVQITNAPPVADAAGPYQAIWGAPVTFAGRASDPGRAPGECCEFTWDFGDGALGQGAGPSHVYSRAGNYTAILSATDKDGAAATSGAQVVIERHATSLVIGAVDPLRYHDLATVSATLGDVDVGQPIVGWQVAFNLGTQSCIGTTDASGVASCAIRIDQAPGDYRLLVDYGGDCDQYLPAVAEVPVEIAKRESSLVLTSPGIQLVGDESVSARLTEDSGAPIANRSVAFAIAGQTVSAPTDADGNVAVSMHLGPGAVSVEASFAGDEFYLGSAATSQLIVAEKTNFVIWGANQPTLDQSLVLGERYVFWGSQWAKQVTGGSYSGRSDFKGYANLVDGERWWANPGNSSNPPANVPNYISVIVSTEATKQGSKTTGNIATRAVLAVDDLAAYGANPGHAPRSTGVLVAVSSTAPVAPTTPAVPSGSGPDPGSSIALAPFVMAAPIAGTAPLEVAFDATRSYDAGGQIVVHAWEFGDGGTASGATVNHTYLRPGCQLAKLRVTDDDGASATHQVAIAPTGTSPIALVTADRLAGPGPLEVRFDASGSVDADGDIASFRWEFGDSAFGLGPSPLHTYVRPGVYVARVTVVDSTGLSSSAEITIDVVNSPPRALITARPRKGPEPLDVAFSARGSTDADGEIASYVWDFGDWSTAVGEETSHVYPNEGLATARLVITDDLGAYSEATQIIEAGVVPGGTPGPPPLFADFYMTPALSSAPSSVHLDATRSTVSGAAIVSYAWEFGDGQSSTDPVVDHAYPRAGMHQVRLTVTDSLGRASTNTGVVFVEKSPPVAQSTVSPTTGAAPLAVTFNGTSSYDPDGTINTYFWSFGDPWAPPGQGGGYGAVIGHTYSHVGTFTARLIVTDNDGIQSSIDTEITVTTEPPVADYVVIPESLSALSPVTVTFDATPAHDPDGTIDAYRWTFYDTPVTSADGKVVSHTFTKSGSFPVALKVTDNAGGTATVTKNYVVNNRPPIADFSASPLFGLAPLKVTFDASASSDQDGTLTYLWNFGDGQTASTTTRVIPHTYVREGIYTATLTARDNLGATDVVTETITVYPAPPQATFTATPQSGLTPLSVTFNASASKDPDGTISTYSWDYGDGMTESGGSTMKVRTHTYTSPGAYSPKLTITDNSGLTATATTTVIASETTPSIAVAPTSVSLIAVAGSASPGIPLEISNMSPDSILAAELTSTAPWLIASPHSSVVYPDSPVAVTVTGSAASLPPGHYETTLTITGAPSALGSPVKIPVRLQVLSAEFGSLSGAVARTNDAAPLVGIPIRVTGPDGLDATTETTTGEDGRYRFGQLRAGQYRVMAIAGTGFVESEIQSTVAVAAGSQASADFTFTPLDTTPPTVSITSPLNPAAPDGIGIDIPEIGCGVEVRGSVADDAAIAFYQIQASPQGAGTWTTIAQGNGDVSDGLLGTICASSLIQGPYELRVVAFDGSQNRTSSQVIAVSVAGDAQPGALKMSFRDVRVPVQGLPIEIYRSYDSTDPASRDFGAGWSLGIFNARVQKDANENVILDIPGHGKRRVFYHTPLDQRGFGGYLLPRYSAGSGAYGTLTQKSYEFNYPLSSCQTIPSLYCSYEFGEEEPYNPQDYQYRSPDGAVWELNVTTGVKSVTDPNGNKLTVTSGGIVSSTGKSITFQRDAAGRIELITDPEGNEYRYGYDVNGDLRTFTNAAGNTTTFDYDGFHHLAKVTDPTGAVPIANSYDARGRLAKTNDAIGGQITYSYDDAQRSQTVADQLGRETTFFYDSRGNVTETVDAQGNSTHRQFDANDNLRAVTDTLGRANSFTWDANGNQTSSTDAEGATTRRSYNAFSEPTTITDPFNHRTNFQYDAKGNLTKTTYADGAEVTTTVDSAGNPIASVGSDGGVWRSSYDGFGNLTGTTNPLGDTSATEYDNNGRPVAFTDPTGAVSSQEYDGLGRVASRTDATGRATRYQYDGNDQVIAVTDPAGATSSSNYDARGKLASRTDPLGNATTYGYDAVGNLAAETDPAGRVTRYGYDNLDRLVAVEDAIGGVTRYDYDPAGQMTRLTDANGHAIEHTYWPTGRLKTNEYADGSQMSFGYDPNGNLTTRTKRDGTNISYTFDSRNRLRITTLESGRQIFADYNTTGLLSSLRDTETGDISYSHNLAQRVTATTKANGQSIGYGHDPAGRVNSLTVAGRSQSWTYDPAGRTATATDFSGQTASLGYDAAGRLATLTRPGAAGATAISYDDAGRVTRVNSGPSLGDFEYALDSVGNRTTMTETLAGFSDTVDYQYDPLNRLTKEQRRSGSVNEFSYDAVGNRTRATGQPDREYDALDQVVGWDYDENGNLLADDEATYAFDELDRLTSATKAGYTSNFTWDPEGNLLDQTQGGVTRSLVVDSQSGLARVLEERDPADNAVTASYSYCSASCTKVMSVENSAGHRWTYADALGSIRTLGDGTGAVTDAKTYNAYGTEGSFGTGTNANPYRFGGERTDASGLQWLRARWYAPDQGRFLNRDSYGGSLDQLGANGLIPTVGTTSAGMHPYLYASGNPSTLLDPTGQVAIGVGGFGDLGISATIQRVLDKIRLVNWASAVRRVLVFAGAATLAHVASTPNPPMPNCNNVPGGKPTNVTDTKLRNVVNDLYRPNAKVGSGSTADAIRHELATGQLVGGVSHLQKGHLASKSLLNLMNSGRLSAEDLMTARQLWNDLQCALREMD